METVVVALVVGAAGGLFGSIAGPWLTHRLSRQRRKEEREEERDRELRRMIETMMALARSASSSTSDLELTEVWGGDLDQSWDRATADIFRIQSLHPAFAWRPHRIKNDDLRTLAMDLNATWTQLNMLLGQRRGLPLGRVQDWSGEAKTARAKADELIEAVDRGMDLLGW